MLTYVSLILLSSCSYDFTPLDSSAVYVLSSMARQRRTSLSSGGAVSPDCDKLERSSSPQSSSSKSNRSHTSGTASGATPTKCKRPMNAFMLFAKKYRVEYTQMYPGKDNRYWGYVMVAIYTYSGAISVSHLQIDIDHISCLFSETAPHIRYSHTSIMQILPPPSNMYI